MPTLLAYSLLFVVVAAAFIFIHLMIGKLVRPKRPDPEKLTIYECGEPTVGSAWVQFDLRFYVVALLFVIFDVEMVFFFPWAVVFNKANTLADPNLPKEQRIALTDEMMPPHAWLVGSQVFERGAALVQREDLLQSLDEHTGPLRTPEDRQVNPNPPVRESSPLAGKPLKTGTPAERARDAADSFAWIAFVDILVFFGVLLVGFAYLWARGDLNWVRSTLGQQEPSVSQAA
ncbi:MAG: NADH-quinone oxidoreductase subunit A [Gemmataceae bacterium]|nr:NADH-quinone oxidoreductase subunit A [Gemmataceae bacterium]